MDDALDQVEGGAVNQEATVKEDPDSYFRGLTIESHSEIEEVRFSKLLVCPSGSLMFYSRYLVVLPSRRLQCSTTFIIQGISFMEMRRLYL